LRLGRNIEVIFRLDSWTIRIRRAETPSGALRGLVSRLASARANIAVTIVATVALVLSAIVMAACQQVFVDDTLIARRTGPLKLLFLALGGAALLSLVAVSVRQVHLRRLEARLAATDATRFVRNLLRLPFSFFQARFSGDISRRFMGTTRVASVIAREEGITVANLLTLVLFVAVMLFYDPFLTALGVAIGGLNLVALQWFSRRGSEKRRIAETSRARLWAQIILAIQSIETIKATHSESDLVVRWAGDHEKAFSAEQWLGTRHALLVAVPSFMAMLAAIAILGIGGRQVAAGTLSIGALLTLQTLLARFNEPFRDLVRLDPQIKELRAEIDRIDDVARRPIEHVFATVAAAPSRSDGPVRRQDEPEHRLLTGQLELRLVSFDYNRAVDEPLIKDFSLLVQPGQRVALVGGSGSGKSTIGRLIAGLYTPWSGELLYDGKPISKIPREVFVNSVALVDDRIATFQGTVAENLTLWDDQVRSDQLVRAGVGSAIHRDLLRRSEGYFAAVAEGGRNFSGGQRQRLGIARALVRDPSLLVFDEATSALDGKTESLVDDELRRRNCSCVIISHRLSTIRDCDEIIVLAGGRVMQRGVHDDLIADRDGEYARLYGHAFDRAGLSTRRAAPSASTVQARPAAVARAGDPVSKQGSPAEAQPAIAPEAAAAGTSEPRFLVEELLPYSRPRQTARNRPLPLDDSQAVWLVSTGAIDVFYTPRDSNGAPGRSRHLCRVEEGGAIFSLSGARARYGGALTAIGVGSAQLLEFSRGDLIRLSFVEGLAEQVAVVIDDWVLQLERGLGRIIGSRGRRDIDLDVVVDLADETRFGIRDGVGWVRHLAGNSLFLEEIRVPEEDSVYRFPLAADLWLTAEGPCRVHAVSTLALFQSGDPWEALHGLHRAVLDGIGRIQAREDRQRWAEIESGVAAQRSRANRSAWRLAAVATETKLPPETASVDATLAAYRVIGHEMGIEVNSPGEEAEHALSDPSAIARASGLHFREIKLPRDWARRRAGEPFLSQLADEANRPVALLPVRRWVRPLSLPYDLYDPYVDRRRPLTRNDVERISSAAWVVHRTLPDHPLKLTDLLRISQRGMGRDACWVVLLAALVGLLTLGVPIGSEILVDRIIPLRGLGAMGWHPLLTLVLVLVSLTSALAICHIVAALLVRRIERKLVPALVPAIWDRVLRLPTRFFDRYSSGDLSHRVIGLNVILQKLAGATGSTVVAFSILVFNLLLIFWYSWRVALVSSLPIGLTSLGTIVLLALQHFHEARTQDVEGANLGFVLELVQGIASVRTAGAEDRAFARWASRSADQLAMIVKSRRLSTYLHGWYAIFPFLIALLLYLGAAFSSSNALSVGSFFALMLAATNVVAAIESLGGTLLAVVDVPSLFARGNVLLQARPESPAAVRRPIRLAGSLALNRVNFSYPGDPHPSKVIEDVSLQVRPGEFVGIVGSSGSGKSTLMRLMLGYETPDEGSVTYDGRDLAMIDVGEVRRQIGVVLQDALLTPYDIFSNIVGSSSGLSPDDAWRAAALAGLEDDIRRMPMGMHTLIGEGGANLSSGQRQRLLIARAIVRRPSILIFDEATSAMDNVTQAIVTDSITNQLRGVTRVMIGQRLNAMTTADRIYVLKDGRIVQSGLYTQLLQEPGPFRELARRQMT
jgi:NHLM bacteriocin system ABC transporter ATP-binding protein